MKIYRNAVFEYWYDRSTRCWWAMQVDDSGNQIDDAFDAYTRGDIEWLIEQKLDDIVYWKFASMCAP